MSVFQEYERYDGLALAELVRRREVSAAELAAAAIERIEARNPRINAVVHRMYDEAKRVTAAPLPDAAFCHDARHEEVWPAPPRRDRVCAAAARAAGGAAGRWWMFRRDVPGHRHRG